VLLIKAAPKADRPSLAPPLGVLTLAASLRAELGAEVTVLDAGFDMYGAAPPPVERVAALVRSTSPHVVGISALTCERDCLAALAAAAKGAASGVTVVAGGPYPTAEPLGWRSAPHVDGAVLGEGDEVFPELVRRVVAGSEWRGLRGVAARAGDSCEAAAPVADLDALPLPAWDLVDLRRYSKPKYRSHTGLPAIRPYAVVCTSRGCPYLCSYCHDVHGKRFRALSPERVLAEVADVVARGARDIHFVDDIFNFDLARSKRIFALIAERHPGVTLAFPNGLRADRLDSEFAVAAKRAGARYAAVAVETASPRIQKLIRKHLNLERTRQAIRWLEDAGIRTRSFVMLGFPTETEAEMEETVRFVIASGTSEASFFNVVPYRGSHLHELAESIAPGLADEASRAPFYSEDSFYAKSTGADLSRIRDRAILRFYLSRSRGLRLLLRMPLRFWFSPGFLETLAYFGVRAARSLLPRAAAGGAS
jgi:radical SAM superfamily enzyme YgiQ (UPF0313 family)